MNKDAAQVKAATRRPRRKDSNEEGAYSGLYVPTGCTLYNLALSDKYNGGYALGKVANTIGDSSAGKSILALTTFAEAARLRKFKDYDLVYDDAEAADEFNKVKLFGPKMRYPIRWRICGIIYCGILQRIGHLYGYRIHSMH
jgi:hypothetical protein